MRRMNLGVAVDVGWHKLLTRLTAIARKTQLQCSVSKFQISAAFSCLYRPTTKISQDDTSFIGKMKKSVSKYAMIVLCCVTININLLLWKYVLNSACFLGKIISNLLWFANWDSRRVCRPLIKRCSTLWIKSSCLGP